MESAGQPAPRKLSPLSRMAVRFIGWYQRRVSGGLGGGCRFQPTCSHYAIAAYGQYGFLKATRKSAWRLLRCNPLNRGARVDPP